MVAASTLTIPPMALFNPPFQALPPEPAHVATALALPQCPPIDQWPTYAYAADRWDPQLGPPRWERETEAQWLERRYQAALFWAAEDAKTAPVVKGRPRLGEVDGESVVERRARQNREAQERYRLRQKLGKGKDIDEVGLTRMYLATQAEIAKLESKLTDAYARLAELAKFGAAEKPSE